MTDSPIIVRNHTATGQIDSVETPNVACAVSIKGRNCIVKIYDQNKSDFFTLESSVVLTINTHNLGKSTLYLQSDIGCIIELCYQDRR